MRPKRSDSLTALFALPHPEFRQFSHGLDVFSQSPLSRVPPVQRAELEGQQKVEGGLSLNE
jgi:hypothetical protein